MGKKETQPCVGGVVCRELWSNAVECKPVTFISVCQWLVAVDFAVRRSLLFVSGLARRVDSGGKQRIALRLAPPLHKLKDPQSLLYCSQVGDPSVRRHACIVGKMSESNVYVG